MRCKANDRAPGVIHRDRGKSDEKADVGMLIESMAGPGQHGFIRTSTTLQMLNDGNAIYRIADHP